MIKSNLANSEKYNHHVVETIKDAENIYVTDYTNHNQANKLIDNNPIKVSKEEPTNIKAFHILNSNKLPLDYVIFDDNSFVDATDNKSKHCEACFFPNEDKENEWIAFLELKYSRNVKFNSKKINEAKAQLIETWQHYYDANIITKANKAYCVISLPEQEVPFTNFRLPQNEIAHLKESKNILLRYTNTITIKDSYKLQL